MIYFILKCGPENICGDLILLICVSMAGDDGVIAYYTLLPEHNGDTKAALTIDTGIVKAKVVCSLIVYLG